MRPAYSRAVAKVGVLSGMSFKLYTSGRTAGALNLFGFEPRQWDSESEMCLQDDGTVGPELLTERA